MANKSCKRNSPLAKLVKQLALLKEEFINQSEIETTTQLEERIANIKQITMFNDPSITEDLFKLALIESGLSDTLDTETENNIGETQLQIESLNYDNFKQIYKNAISAHAHMLHLLKSRLFQAAFVNTTNYGDQTDNRGRLLNDTVKRIPTSAGQFNAGIINLKNELFGLIIDNLGLEETNKPFSRKGADEETFIRTMNDARVLSFLNRMKTSLETASEKDLDTHSALVILNNFDKLLKKELGKVIKIDPDNMGKLSNIQYISEAKGEYTSHWITDDLESYDSNLYQTNIGKFILNTIQKVDSYGKPIPGRFMSSGDAFMISDILKTAEVQYHILKKFSDDYKPDLSFKNNTKETLRILLESKDLPIISKFEKELLPIYNYLYKDTDENFSIRTVTSDVINKGQVNNINSLLDIEGILAFELAKNVAPAYMEYSVSGRTGNGRVTQSIGRTIALGHSYKANSYITDNLKAQILNQLLLNFTDRNPILSGIYPKSKYDSKTMSQLLGNEAPEYKELFKLLFNSDLTEDFIFDLGYGNPETAIKSLTAIFFSLQDMVNKVSRLTTIEEQGSLFLKEFENGFNNKRHGLNSFYSNLLQTIADRNSDIPNTIIKDSRGKSIPIYRLNSTILEDSYLLLRLRLNNIYRDDINFFVNNMHAISTINNPNPKVGESVQENLNYPGNTAIRLETVLLSGSNPAKKSSGLETFLNSILGDFISLGIDSHTFGTQLMTYSDKSSVFLKLVNLDAIVKKYGDKEINKSLWQMSNDELFDLFYFYRRNQMVDRVYHILETWQNSGLVGDLHLPEFASINFNSTADLSIEVFNLLQTAWTQVNEKLAAIDPKKFDSILENTIRTIKKINPDYEVVKELHYCKYGKKQPRLNKNIFYHLYQIKDKDTFRKLQQGYTLALIEDEWFNSLRSFLNLDTNPASIAAKSLIEQLAKDLGIESDEVFPKELLYRRTLLDNFFRIQFNDLHFKGPHLDKAKNIPDYDETDPRNIKEWLSEEKKRFEAAGKRTVDLPGTKENFAQNLINGVPVIAKVAIVNEPEEEVFNPMGDHDSLEVLNGSARISPIYAYQETASLPGENFSGDNRKVLGMDMGDYRATLFKYAEYVINNWHMRTSERSKYQLQRLFRKMHDLPFKEDIDLTKTFFRTDMHFTPKMANDGLDVYFAKGINYFKLVDIIRVGENTYDLIIKTVDEHGGEYEDLTLPSTLETKNVKIQSLYDLYTKALGGIESMSLIDGRLQYSESSLKMLYNYVTNIGEVIDTELGVFTQETVYQPLRNYFYSMIASNTGIKRGETNTNNEIIYQNNEPLLGFNIHTACFGKQLDAHHDIGVDSNTTEPTQTMAALATNGNTLEEAQETYRAIAQVIRTNMKTIDRLVYKQHRGAIESVLLELSKEIYKTINKSNDINQSLAIYDLIHEYLGNILPISDPSFYKQVHIAAMIDLNSRALRRKYPGLGGVLNPSVNTMLLFSIKTSSGQEFTYDDLIRIGRLFFNQEAFDNLTTEEMVALTIFTLSDYGKSFDWGSLNSDEAPTFITNVIKNILSNYDLKEITTETELSTAKNIVLLVGKKITLGQAEPLDTVFVVKGDKIQKVTLDTAKKFFNLVRDTKIDELYLDLSTPHDLKPLIVNFIFDNAPMSIYQTMASLLAYNIQEILDPENNFLKLLDNLEESGAENINSCKIKI